MISEHSAHSTPLPVGIRTWLWRYTCLLLWISMHWHTHAIFESKYIQPNACFVQIPPGVHGTIGHYPHIKRPKAAFTTSLPTRKGNLFNISDFVLETAHCTIRTRLGPRSLTISHRISISVLFFIFPYSNVNELVVTVHSGQLDMYFIQYGDLNIQ